MSDERIDAVAFNLLLGARPRDDGLTDASPVSAGVSHHRRPTTLEVDIHRGLELGVLLRGEQERVFQDFSTTARAGDVWLSAMWEPHAWRARVPGTQAVICTFLPEFIGEESLLGVSWLTPFAAAPARRPQVRTPQMRRHMLDIGKELHREVVSRSPGWQSALRIGILRVLLCLIRQWESPQPRGGGGPIYASGLSRVMPVLEMVHADPGRPLSLPEAASACGLSRSRFMTVFRQTTRLSFAAFRLRARLAFAARKLLTTHDTVASIAADAGFVDASHLHHAFVKHYHRTPGHFRQQRT